MELELSDKELSFFGFLESSELFWKQGEGGGRGVRG
jgi:hypothetical protein